MTGAELIGAYPSAVFPDDLPAGDHQIEAWVATLLQQIHDYHLANNLDSPVDIDMNNSGDTQLELTIPKEKVQTQFLP